MPEQRRHGQDIAQRRELDFRETQLREVIAELGRRAVVPRLQEVVDEREGAARLDDAERFFQDCSLVSYGTDFVERQVADRAVESIRAELQ